MSTANRFLLGRPKEAECQSISSNQSQRFPRIVYNPENRLEKYLEKEREEKKLGIIERK